MITNLSAYRVTHKPSQCVRLLGVIHPEKICFVILGRNDRGLT